jgi:hypothetical protein
LTINGNVVMEKGHENAFTRNIPTKNILLWIIVCKKSIQAWDIYSVQAKNFAIKIYSENFGEYKPPKSSFNLSTYKTFFSGGPRRSPIY